MINNKDWTVISGPCTMDSEELYLDTGSKMCEIMKGRNWYYKSSFFKGNRSSIKVKLE